MLSGWKLRLRNVFVALLQALGSPIRDERTGEVLGRGLVLVWRGRVHLFGLNGGVLPLPIPQPRITYWHQSIGFTRPTVPDFPRRQPAMAQLAASPARDQRPQPLVVVLDHRSPEQVADVLNWWRPTYCDDEHLLLAYGGPAATFDRIETPNRIFINDPRLRTRDHQREAQSYRDLIRAVAQWMNGRAFTHVLFMEADHLPLSADLLSQLTSHLISEDADVLGYQLERLDGTTHPHYLNALTLIPDPGVVLSMLGTGHFWKREAWDAVAQSGFSDQLYLELDLPTAAHHDGFRVRPLPADQEQFVRAKPDLLTFDPGEARSLGAWSIHPVKSLP